MTTAAVVPVPPALDSELPTLGDALDPAIRGRRCGMRSDASPEGAT